MRIRTMTVVVWLLAVPFGAAAQDRVEAGVIAGPSVATFAAKRDTVDPPDFTSRAGFSGGLFLVSPAHRHVAFEPEVLFTLKGANGSDATTNVSLRATYLEFPLLARFQPVGDGRTSMHVVAGPVVGIRLAASQTLETSAGKVTEDLKDQSHAGAMSLVVGAGVDAGRFRFDGRYTWGLSRLNTDRSAGFEIRTRELTFFAGVTLW